MNRPLASVLQNLKLRQEVEQRMTPTSWRNIAIELSCIGDKNAVMTTGWFDSIIDSLPNQAPGPKARATLAAICDEYSPEYVSIFGRPESLNVTLGEFIAACQKAGNGALAQLLERV